MTEKGKDIAEQLDEGLLQSIESSIYAFAVLCTDPHFSKQDLAAKLRGYLQASPELLAKYEKEWPLINNLPGFLRPLKTDGQILSAFASNLFDEFNETYGEMGWYDNVAAHIAISRAYFILLTISHGQEEAVSMFKRATRRNLICEMIDNDEIVPEFLLSLDADDRRFFDEQLAAMRAIYYKHTEAEISEKSEQLINKVIETVAENVRKEVLDEYPDIEPAFVERIVDREAHMVQEWVDALPSAMDEHWNSVREFLKDPSRIDPLLEELIENF